MYPLIQFLVQMALLRRAPQDLPPSTALLAIFIAIDLAISSAVGQRLYTDDWSPIGVNLVNIVALLVLVHLALKVRRHPARWLQTATGYFGLQALFGVLTGLLVSLGEGQLAGLAVMVLTIWMHVALGHVLRHALEVDHWLGIGLAFAFSLLAESIAFAFFPLDPAIAEALLQEAN